MDLPELLRSQARRYRCAACGKSMADCGINVLAQQGNRALVRVTCSGCQDENLLQIIFQTDGDFSDGGDELMPAATIDEGMPAVTEPISADELLDVHALLADFDAGLRELVEPRT